MVDRATLGLPGFAELAVAHFHDYHTAPLDHVRRHHTLGHAHGLALLRGDSARSAPPSALTGASAVTLRGDPATMAGMHPVPLVATTRGDPDTGLVTENVHMRSVAVVDAAGKLLWYAGDPQGMTFTRSALKPFQAPPFVLADGPARLGLSRTELALLCASHSGEDKHVRTVHAILERIGCGEDALECGCHAPLYYDSVGVPAPPGRSWNALQHHCSGKHSGFLAWRRLHDVSSAG